MMDSITPFDISETYIDLRGVNTAKPLPTGGDFWWQLASGGISPKPDRLLMRSCQTRDWTYWERHPIGDEVVIQISGRSCVILDGGDTIQEIELNGFQTVIIPRKRWHRFRIMEAADMLFITPGEGTEHKPL